MPGDSTVIERLTRVSDTEIVYQFSVVDPEVVFGAVDGGVFDLPVERTEVRARLS